MFKNDILTKTLICIFVLSLLIFGSINHEIWRDEGHYIQIAKELSFFQLLAHSRVEGLIPTHPIILKLLFPFFDNKVLALKFFNIAIYSLIFFIFLKSKTPFFITILFMLCYPIFYYGIVNRYYITLIPPVTYLLLFDNKKEIYKQLSYLSLSVSGIFGLFFLFSYVVANLKNEMQSFLKNKIIYLFIILIASISFFYYTLPYEGRNWNNIQISSSYEIIRSWYELFFASAYIHNFFREFNIATEISIPFLFVNILTILSVTITYITILTLYAKKDFSLLIFFISSLAIYLSFFAITGHHSFRHYFIFSIILYLVNIKSLFIDNKKINYKKFNISSNYKIYEYLFLFIILIIAILSAIKFNAKISKSEVSHSYLILNYLLVFFTAQNLYFKKKNIFLTLLLTIFFIYFFYFSIRGGNSYNSTFIISATVFLINSYLIFINNEKYDFLKFKVF